MPLHWFKSILTRPLVKTPPVFQVPPHTRIYAVGDIHGRSDLLDRVTEHIDIDVAAHPARHVIEIYLGDYIDRGPDSKGTIDRLIGRMDEPHSCIFLMGNHEATLLDFLDDPRILRQWRRYGGLETLVSYGVDYPMNMADATLEACRAQLRDKLPEAHLSFMRQCRLFFQIGDYLFVHAGIRPGIRLEGQSRDDLLWIRDEFTAYTGSLPVHVVHGHTPVAEPNMTAYRSNIDTGAYDSGRLTILKLDNDGRQIWQASLDKIS